MIQYVPLTSRDEWVVLLWVLAYTGFGLLVAFFASLYMVFHSV